MNNNNTHRGFVCDNCFDWDYKKTVFNAPSDYPDDEEKVLKGTKISFANLLSCVEKAYNKFNNNN